MTMRVYNVAGQVSAMISILVLYAASRRLRPWSWSHQIYWNRYKFLDFLIIWGPENNYFHWTLGKNIIISCGQIGHPQNSVKRLNINQRIS